jgi:hypothetical protein
VSGQEKADHKSFKAARKVFFVYIAFPRRLEKYIGFLVEKNSHIGVDEARYT